MYSLFNLALPMLDFHTQSTTAEGLRMVTTELSHGGLFSLQQGEIVHPFVTKIACWAARTKCKSIRPLPKGHEASSGASRCEFGGAPSLLCTAVDKSGVFLAWWAAIASGVVCFFVAVATSVQK